MTELILHASLIVCLLISALAAVELKNLIYAALAFAVMGVFLGAIYFLLLAPYVAVFQLIIYAGAVTVLLLATITLIGRRSEDEE
ncbi:MAG: NADH-quinone oxidoreductase subunit J family protein [Candidatus Odinarchaeia archaeon]